MTTQRTSEELAKRERIICGYLKLAAVLMAHPEAELPFSEDGGACASIYATTQQQWEDTIKAFGVEGAPEHGSDGRPFCFPIPGLNLRIFGLHTPPRIAATSTAKEDEEIWEVLL